MSNDLSMSALLADIAARDRSAYDVLGAMPHKYAVNADELIAISRARAMLAASAKKAEWDAKEIHAEELQGVRA